MAEYAASVNILTRENYDELSPKQSYDIYLVQEESSESGKMVSMYVGESRIGDLLDITSHGTYDSSTNTYTFDSDVEVPGKLFYLYDEHYDTYNLYIYKEDSDSFVSCGQPDHVHVYQQAADIPASKIINDIYITTLDKQMFVYDGSQLISLLSSGVGESTVGKTMGGYTGGAGSERFNDYTNNISAGDYSHAEGTGTKSLGYASHSSGFGTVASESYQTAIGIYNAPTTAANSRSTSFVIGNGTSDSSRNNAIEVTGTGNILLEPSKVGTTPDDQLSLMGNVRAATGAKLASCRFNRTVQDNSAVTFSQMPFNGTEYRIGVENNTIRAITFTSVTTMDGDPSPIAYGGLGTAAYAVSPALPIPGDYHCVLIYRKHSSITSASDLLTNFADDSAQHIYLLNPSIDISEFTVIHILIYYDGIAMCAVVAGYKEVTPL